MSGREFCAGATSCQSACGAASGGLRPAVAEKPGKALFHAVDPCRLAASAPPLPHPAAVKREICPNGQASSVRQAIFIPADWARQVGVRVWVEKKGL